MKAKKKNKNNIVILVILFFSIGIGYAIINSSLNINIGLKVKKNKTIYFDNVRIVDGSVSAVVAPIADKHNTIVNFSINLSNINDTYTFYIDMKNNKKIQYMLSEIIKTGLTEEQDSIIDYNVYYENGDDVIINELFQNRTDSVKVEVKVKEEITSIEPQTLNLSLELKYVQATNSAIFEPYYYLKEKAISDSSLDFSGTSGTGIYELTESKNDEFPVYFYRGTSNNKVIFNNMCWNVIRTTNTRGTKLIYAGVPNSSGSCSNTTNSTSTIGSSKYTETTALISSVGYMYDDINTRELKKKNLSENSKSIYGTRSNGNTTTGGGYSSYYYASSVVSYSSSGSTSCTYRTSSSSSSPATLKGKWTNFSTSISTHTRSKASNESCPTIQAKDFLNYYIFETDTITNTDSIGNSSTRYEYNYISKQNYGKFLYFGSDYTKNEDGTYTLTDAESFSYIDWYSKSKSNYIGKFVCFDNSDTCENPIYVKTANSVISGIGQNIKFAKQVTYENGIYTLVDPIDEYVKNKDTITAEYHYSCLTAEDTCENVAYIINYGNDIVSYFSLTNGEDAQIDSLITHENETDSSVKLIVDEWFTNNMTNVQDKIEDTVYCNDRSISNDSYNENGMFLSDIIYGGNARKTANTPSVKCPLERDSFTMSPDLGNGKLTYPVGLITMDELNLVLGAIQGSGYSYFTMTPSRYKFSGNTSQIYYITSGTNTGETSLASAYSYYIRPVISLKYGVKFYDGDGSETSPYKVYGDS